MPSGPPRKPRPPIPQPSPEEAEFFLWLASQRPRPPRFDRSRFPYAPSPARRYPWSPGGMNPWGPEEAEEEAPEPQQPPAPAVNPPAPPAAAPEPPWRRPHPGYRGILAPREPRGLLDLDISELFPTPLSDGLAQWAAMVPPAPAAPAQAKSPAQAPQRGYKPPAAPAQPPRPTAMRGTQIAQSDRPGDARDAIPRPAPKPPVPRRHDIYAGVPEYKRDYLRDNDQGQNWVDFIQATGFLPQVGAAEKEIYREIYAAEGGNVPDGATVAGITKGILPALVRTGDLPESFADKLPEDLTQRERAKVYRAYMNNAFQNVSGYRTLEEFDNPALAAFMADTVFREGAPEGAALIHDALNHVLGDGTVSRGRGFRRRDLELINNLTREQEDRLADYLAEIRAEKYLRKPNYKGEKARAEHFRNLVKNRTY